MGAQLNFTLGELAPWLDQVAEDAAKMDWTPAFKKIALLLEESTKENFEKGTAPDGTPWKPLKYPRNRPRDIRAKRSVGNDQRPLRDKGLLMASLSAMGQNHVQEISSNLLNWGTNLEYAGVHQFGHTFNRPERRRDKPWVFKTADGRTVFTKKIRAHTQTVPARPYLGMTTTLREDIEAVIREEFQKQVLRPAP